MSITRQELWTKAAEYLARGAGHSPNKKRSLRLLSQEFDQASNSQNLVFKLSIQHPVKVKSDEFLADNENETGKMPFIKELLNNH